jgi:Domain of unknown function (DUF6285)
MAARGAPTTAELIEAVREFLRDEVMPETEGRLQFHARVAANLLAVVEREVALGPAYAAAHAQRLASLGVEDDAELASAIRDGRLDDRIGDVVDAMRASTFERLCIANPRYLVDEDRARVAPDSPAATVR